MIDPVLILKAAGKLAAIRYYPSDPDARGAVMDLIGRMVTDERQLEWLVTAVIDRMTEWPGAAGLRTLFVSRFIPHDGVDPAHPGEDVRLLQDGRRKLLGYVEAPQLPPAPTLMLTDGRSEEPVTLDRQMLAAVVRLASKRNINRVPNCEWTEHDEEVRRRLEALGC